MAKFKLENSTVSDNVKKLQKHMQENNVEMFYVSSYDPYLNEYVPMSDCHRYYVTGFSGSVAEALVPAKGKVKVYVDGRYHEQADLECDKKVVEVVKVPQGESILSCLKADLARISPKNIAHEADRTTLSFFKYLNDRFEVRSLLNQELGKIITFKKNSSPKPIEHLTPKVAGSSVKEKLDRIFKDFDGAYFVTAIDSLAWVTNCRGYHLPNLSSFLGRGLITKNKIYVFIDKGVEYKCSNKIIEFINCDSKGLQSKLEELQESLNLTEVRVDENTLNSLDYLLLKDVFGEIVVKSHAGGLIAFQSIKTKGELDAMRANFKRSDRAIFNTLKWVKSNLKKKSKISELDLYNQTTKEYKKQGAVEQSFGTISGAGANGSIIHYSDPKAKVIIKESDMVLLDSGGYFENGFATDTTRTFMAGAREGSDKHKEIYTLVLKGTLNLQNAIFKEGTLGGGLDAICRQPLYQAGYDYAHGTGHGVGVHVHESGVRIGPGNTGLMKAGQVVSIEPGIYIPGFGGVRIENIGIVENDPQHKGFLRFESLVYIGYEPLLIEPAMLSDQELHWLEEYEAECVVRGTSFR